MEEPHDLPEDTPVELIDFSGTSLPRHIQITEQLTHGPVMIGRYILRPNAGVVIGTSQHAVVLHEGDPFEMDWRLPGSHRYEHKWMVPNDIHIHPSDTLLYKRWTASSRMLFIACDRNFTQQIVDEAFEHYAVDLPTQIGIRDQVIEGMAVAWREELKEHGAGGRIYAEGLASALIVHVFRTYGRGGTQLRPTTGGLNGPRKQRVLEYIEAHFKEDISLDTLAKLAGLSSHHFSEVFKTTTGHPPHQFVTERRILYARELLAGTNRPIAEIALDVGFSSHSQLSVAFGKIMGITPLRYRRHHR
jgi:AraC family transcriptional regulator